MFRAYLAAGVLAVALFAHAQYRGWSLLSTDVSRPAPGTTRSAFHK